MSNNIQNHKEENNNSSTSEIISSLTEKCYSYGKNNEFDQVVETATLALNRLPDLQRSIEDYNIVSSFEATLLGYKGYALMMLNKTDDAIQALSRSYELWVMKKRGVAILSPNTKKKSKETRRLEREFIVVEKALKKCCVSRGIAVPCLPPLIKFTRTLHLFDTGGTAVTSDDLVFSKDDYSTVFNMIAAADRGTSNNNVVDVIMEEKVDGSNVGFSLDANENIIAQNRSHYISSKDQAQYNTLSSWIEEHRESLMKILKHTSKTTTTTTANNSPQINKSTSQGLILYGEWVVAKHSIPYDRLPGQFIAYDRFHERFYSRQRFYEVMRNTIIPVTPVIDMCQFSSTTTNKQKIESELKNFLELPSMFRKDGGFLEGVVLRIDDTENQWLEHRLKIVRPDFVAGCDDGHWMSHSIQKQVIDYDFREEYLKECCSFFDNHARRNIVKGSDDTENQVEKDTSVTKPPATLKEMTTTTTENTLQKQQQQKKKLTKSEIKTAREQAAAKARLQRNAPKYVMIMGLPASGKSTFATTLESEWRTQQQQIKKTSFHHNSTSMDNIERWVVVNQDKLGRKACVDLAGKSAGMKNLRVVLDRCNTTEKEREEWVNILKSPGKSQIALVYFVTDKETCIERAQKRVGHETIPEGRGRRIIEDMSKRIEPPTENERKNLFRSVDIVHTYEDSRAVLRKWGCY
eukprot:CAMPEP_0178964414 /NCGR_PEP_ID=MMETSP0789-20121207/15655_1 /TAXON_ID=3005 /ORGANISM="Rhizosolenia setigera, Strain CCMP 1694" /LENGTH=690 /DNA_ID=CAMNT_0020649169 /DNA_START=15 /DNA_END=2087 /DNA_ORIENTATION=+